MRVAKTGLVIAALTMAAVVSAQSTGNKKTAEERAQQKTERMAEELSLTEDQKSKVLALSLEAVKKHDEIKNNASLSEEQKKEQLQASHKEMKAKVDALLTDEQRAKAKEKHQEMRGLHGHDEKGTPEERAQRHTERMTEMLSLTDGQISQVQAINLEAVKKADELRAGTTLSEEEKHAAMKAHHEATKEKISAVLTEEQRALLQEKHEAMKAEMKEQREKWSDATPEQRAQMKTERMAEELSLAEEQKKKLTDLHLRTDKKAEGIRNDKALTDDQRKTALKDVHQEMRKELKTILTEEQLKQLKERKHPHEDAPDND